MDFINKSLVSILFLSCGIVNRLKDAYTYLSITYKPFRDLLWYINISYRTITFQHIEPYKSPWMSKSWLTPDMTSITSRYVLNEQYKTNFDEVFISIFDILYDTMNATFTTFCNDIIRNKTGLFIMKILNEDNEDAYFVSINRPQIPSTIKKSAAKFLSIEYKHPEMEKSIEINMDKSWFYTGNELFTSTFVLRVLKYQLKHFFFDMNYKICIMDNNINIIEFGSNKHILLTEDGYELVDNELADNEIVDNELVDNEEHEDEDDSEIVWRETYELCGQFLNDIS